MSGGVQSVLFGAIVLIGPDAGALGLIWAIGAYSIVFGIVFLFVAPLKADTLSSFDSVSYRIEIDLCRALVSQGSVIGIQFVHEAHRSCSDDWCTSVAEFELMKVD